MGFQRMIYEEPNEVNKNIIDKNYCETSPLV